MLSVTARTGLLIGCVLVEATAFAGVPEYSTAPKRETRTESRRDVRANNPAREAPSKVETRSNDRSEIKRVEAPNGLKNSEAYTRYAAILIQLDMLSNRELAYLPVTAEMERPGLIKLSGTVPNEQTREYILENARRISGLLIKQTLRVGEAPRDFFVEITPDKLEKMTNETVQSLFPDAGKSIHISTGDAGEIVISGNVDSYEIALLLAQTVKSQPGCESVINMVSVRRDAGGSVAVGSGLTLHAQSLPKIPSAQPFDSSATVVDHTSKHSGMNDSSPLLADDVPGVNQLDRQIREDSLNLIRREPALASARLEVDVKDGVVQVTGKLRTKDQARALAGLLTQLPEADKVVGKCEPISVQCGIKRKSQFDEPTKTAEPKKFLGMFRNPFSKTDQEKSANWNNWRYRDSVRKTLTRNCGERVNNVKVTSNAEGLNIEADVAHARDRTYVLGELDKLTQLKSVPYTAILRIEQSGK